jgi:hypothetical protein
MALTDNKENKTQNENIVDITLDGMERTKFRINGRNDAIIELNLSDLGVIERLETGLDKLQNEMTGIANLSSDDENLSDSLKQADIRMREAVDYIFDYPVSDVCAKYGTMYDPKDGKFRYEIIIDGLMRLYTDNINAEYRKLENRLKKHTEKYTVPAKKKKR